MPRFADHYLQSQKDLDTAYSQAPLQVHQFVKTMHDVVAGASADGDHVSPLDITHIGEAPTHFPLPDDAEIELTYAKDSVLAARLHNGKRTPHNLLLSWQDNTIAMQYYDRESQSAPKQNLCKEHAHRPAPAAEQLAFADRIKLALALV